MKTLYFTNNDAMPQLGLGTWKSSPGEIHTAIAEALRIGYRHIDCAPIYGNEKEIGAALIQSFEDEIVQREELWITSKLWNNAHAPEDVLPAIKKTLEDLQLEYLDLFLIHWPVHQINSSIYPASGKDYIAFDQLPIDTTWKAMEDLVAKGLTKHIGVSNFSVEKLKYLVQNSEIKPEMNQIELHPYLQQPSMLEYCKQNGILLTAYAPLGSADRPSALKSADEPVLLKDPVISKIADSHSVSNAQVLINWALSRNTAVIPKSVNPERLKQNLASAELILTADELAQIDGLNRDRRYVSGDFWTGGGSPYTVAGIWDE